MPRDATFCGVCGTPVSDDLLEDPVYELVLPDGARVPLAAGQVTLGRAAESTIRISDASVSRRHAVIAVSDREVRLEDAGSSHGTLLDGRPLVGSARLVDGSVIGLGDVELRLERQRRKAEAGRTIMVPVGATVMVAAAGPSALVDAPAFERPEGEAATDMAAFRPRLRSGFALKRLEAGEGERRWILQSLRSGTLVRMGDEDAALLELIDGNRSLPELIAEAEDAFGPGGAGRLAGMLADLGAKGMLKGTEAEEQAARGGWRKLLKPREIAVQDAGGFFERLYRRGGFVLFTKPAYCIFVALAVVGFAAFVLVLAARETVPFVIARSIGLGGLVFMLGRFLVVAIHELAHGLTVASFGRRVTKAGVKFIAIFPFAFVDTSAGWFETRRRRMAISAAGPVSDFVVAGTFALAAYAAPVGTFKDLFFQITIAGYTGAFFNLNPLLDRDGYHLLVDGLREPNLRQRSRERLKQRVSGAAREEGERKALVVYAAATLAFPLLIAAFVIILVILFKDILTAIAPEWAVWSVLGAFTLLLTLPILLAVVKPLFQRRRRTSAVTEADVAT